METLVYHSAATNIQKIRHTIVRGKWNKL